MTDPREDGRQLVSSPSGLLRLRDHHGGARVSPAELFFDLVFVLAVTQLSHTLIAHLTAENTVQVALLLLAVWCVWIYTSWVTNWLDPERIPVRLCLFVLLLAGLLASVSLPEAFAQRGLTFAAAYVFMQIGRTLFFLWAVRGASVTLTRNFQRILVWMTVSAVFWLSGGLAGRDSRIGWWAIALAIELGGPWLYFRVPGLGRSHVEEWNIVGSHLAERCALFVIIALGESLLVTGATFARLDWNGAAITALVVAVLGSVAMWWVYFDTGAERASRRIEQSQNPGRQGRLVYTYLHALIVGGVIVSAVGDEIVLVHPGHATTAGVLAIFGGSILYLLGNALFKWATNDRPVPPLSHLAGIGILSAALPVALNGGLSTLALGMFATSVLVLVAVWESVALRRPAWIP